MKILLICLLLAAVSCTHRPPRPVELEATDMCAQCKMAISEKRYAAEIVDRDGNVIKFDNVGCMARYASAHDLKAQAAAWFVMDSDGREWLDARQALLVKSASIPGPMGSGILASKEQTKAEDLAKKFSGQTIRFDDLWKEQ
jgi:copper chaperone NosL